MNINLKNIFGAFLILLILLVQFQVLSYAFWSTSSPKEITTLEQKFEYININWWKNFSDPYLKTYIEKALSENEDLKVATLKTEQYREFIKQTFAKELPELSMGSNFAAIKIPYSQDRALNISDSAYVLPFTVNYEADLLLKNHDKTKSAKKHYQSQRYQEKAVYISIASYVATVYVNILKNDNLIELQRGLVVVKKEELSRMQKKYALGLASSIEVNTYQDAYKQALNGLDSYTKSRDILLNEFCVLIGESPNNAQCIERGKLDDFCFCGVLPDCIPSDVIFGRPDVLSAESELAAAKVDVRVARKDLFPTFNIAGVLGFNTFTTESFFSWQGSFAYLLAGATQSLFTGGRKFATLRLQKNIYEQMFENYRQTNLKAVQEVNDSLCSIKLDTSVDDKNFNRQKIEENTFIRMEKKHDRGVISTPDLLGEREKVISVQSEKVNSKAAKLINYLSLYKAAGGSL